MVGGLALFISFAATPATHPTSQPVSLDEVRERGVIGQLGVPLGTMVEVTGTVVPNNSRRKADGGEPFFLQIYAVDGKPLTKPVEYAFRERLPGYVTSPKVGESFDLRGYETGGYDGVPLHYSAPWQDTGFYFTTKFLVLPTK
jgi:hypothetical protein